MLESSIMQAKIRARFQWLAGAAFALILLISACAGPKHLPQITPAALPEFTPTPNPIQRQTMAAANATPTPVPSPTPWPVASATPSSILVKDKAELG